MKGGIWSFVLVPQDAVSRGILRTVLFLVAVFSVNAAHGQSVDRFAAVFPQVVRGNQFETLILLSNPHAEAVEVTLGSYPVGLLPGTSPDSPRLTLKLEPGQTQKIQIAGDDWQAGSVELDSAKAISATAHILIRSSSGPNEVLSQLTLRAQQPASKFVIPVFRKAPGSAEGTFADDTGIAIAALQPGELVLTLRDNSGKTVASKSLQSSLHTAGFLGELLSQTPAEFSSGSLAIEHVQPLISLCHYNDGSVGHRQRVSYRQSDPNGNAVGHHVLHGVFKNQICVLCERHRIQSICPCPNAARTPENTTISAILVLNCHDVPTWRAEITLARLERKLGRCATKEELEEMAKGGKVGPFEDVPRVVVFENPFACRPLPRDLFDGPYDERWGPEGNDIIRVFAGTEIQRLETESKES